MADCMMITAVTCVLSIKAKSGTTCLLLVSWNLAYFFLRGWIVAITYIVNC